VNSLIDQLEADLQGLADSAPPSVAIGDVHRRISRRRRRSGYRRAAAVTVCVTVLVGGLVLLNGREPRSTGTAPDSTSSDDDAGSVDATAPLRVGGAHLPDRGADFVGAEDPPLVSMPAGRWTVSHFDDTTTAHDRLVIVDSIKGFAGGSFAVLPASDSAHLSTGTNLAGDGINGIMTGDSDSFRWIEWHVGDHLLSAHARDLTRADALSIVKSISIEPDGSVVASSVPAGLVALPATETTNLNRYVEYEWTSADPTRTIGVTLQPGGNLGVELAAGSEPPPISFGGRTAYVTNDGMGVVLVDGFWVWSIGGTGFPTSADFLFDAARMATTYRAAWEAELSGHVVLPSERPQQVAEIVRDIPLPPGFDLDTLANEDTAKERYQLIAEVTSAVWCAWAGRWDAALTAGDTDAAKIAASAIGSSRSWHSLNEIVDQGDWAEAVWEDSTRVTNGDRTVIAEAGSGLGCGS
jgi:hypothetical protein